MQRTVFRIEEMIARRHMPNHGAAPGVDERDRAFASIQQDLAEMRAAIARAKAEFSHVSLARAQHELAAAVAGMETGTENILKSAEGADEAARNLVASLHDDYKRGLAQDVLDHVTRIYEHCNFQDLSGQRINKVSATLQAIENKLARIAESWNGGERAALLNGPKLDGDRGHKSQAEIDRMFA